MNNDDNEIFGNDHFRDFYRRPDVQAKMRRIYDRSQVTATIRARAQPRKQTIGPRISVMRFPKTKIFSFD